MNKNAGQAELLRFTCKVIFSAQMVINRLRLLSWLSAPELRTLQLRRKLR